jgi:hypothetical protein
MARVPVQRERSVQQAGLPQVFQSSRGATIDAFGGDGSGTAAMARGFGEAANSLSAITLEIQQEDNEAEAKNLETEWRTSVSTLLNGDGTEQNPGYYSSQSKDALTGFAPTQTSLTELRDDLLGRASNDDVRDMFDAQSSSLYFGHIDKMSGHVSEQRVVSLLAASDARIEATNNDAALDFDNSESYNAALVVNMNEVNAQADLRGSSDEERALALQLANDITSAAVVTAAIERDPSNAYELFTDVKGNMTPLARAALADDVLTQTKYYVAQEWIAENTAILAGKSIDEQVALVRGKGLPGEISQEISNSIIEDFRLKQAVLAAERETHRYSEAVNTAEELSRAEDQLSAYLNAEVPLALLMDRAIEDGLASDDSGYLTALTSVVATHINRVDAGIAATSQAAKDRAAGTEYMNDLKLTGPDAIPLDDLAAQLEEDTRNGTLTSEAANYVRLTATNFKAMEDAGLAEGLISKVLDTVETLMADNPDLKKDEVAALINDLPDTEYSSEVKKALLQFMPQQIEARDVSASERVSSAIVEQTIRAAASGDDQHGITASLFQQYGSEYADEIYREIERAYGAFDDAEARRISAAVLELDKALSGKPSDEKLSLATQTTDDPEVLAAYQSFVADQARVSATVATEKTRLLEQNALSFARIYEDASATERLEMLGEIDSDELFDLIRRQLETNDSLATAEDNRLRIESQRAASEWVTSGQGTTDQWIQQNAGDAAKAVTQDLAFIAALYARERQMIVVDAADGGGYRVAPVRSDPADFVELFSLFDGPENLANLRANQETFMLRAQSELEPTHYKEWTTQLRGVLEGQAVASVQSHRNIVTSVLNTFEVDDISGDDEDARVFMTVMDAVTRMEEASGAPLPESEISSMVKRLMFSYDTEEERYDNEPYLEEERDWNEIGDVPITLRNALDAATEAGDIDIQYVTTLRASGMSNLDVLRAIAADAIARGVIGPTDNGDKVAYTYFAD